MLKFLKALLILLICLTFCVKASEPYSLKDNLVFYQRYNLLKWAATLDRLDKHESSTKLSDLEPFLSSTDDQLRDYITKIINKYKDQHDLNSILVGIDSRPEILDSLSRNYGIHELLDEIDVRFGKFSFEKKKEKIHPIIREFVKTAPRQKLMGVLKYIDFHVKRGRTWLSEGVLRSLDKMSDDQVRNWILIKLTQHDDLNNPNLINQS